MSEELELDDLNVDVDTVDMELNPEVTSELLGGERYKYVADYQRLSYNARANTAVGNTQQADAAQKQMAAIRMTVALIDRDCPEAKKKMKGLLERETALLKARREQ